MFEKSKIKTGVLKIRYANYFVVLGHEDMYTHHTKLYEISGMLRAPENEEKELFIRLFRHSLIGKAKYGYLDQPTSTMTNWKLLEEKFLNIFFPHNKFMEAKITIKVFSQRATKTLFEEWETYKSMMRQCPT